ncbi:unnamed protein product [Adineta steineri]|uniref:Uncharacterized protein n=1 Tax=Adineta steineri TaxID=433720 RepID=A0A815D3D4_9BILA|nr:unnamed protein product [Adineta steineri]CAF1354355.1 unnamed protein product [Adineta steineri]
MNHNLNETVDKLTKENDQLLTNVNTLLNEKEEQYKQLTEVDERLNGQTILNEHLSRKLNKNEQRFVKLEMDFQEEKLTNKQLVENVQNLKNEMDNKDKKIIEIRAQVNALILHISCGDKLKQEANEDELKQSKIIIKKTRDTRRKLKKICTQFLYFISII